MYNNHRNGSSDESSDDGQYNHNPPAKYIPTTSSNAFSSSDDGQYNHNPPAKYIPTTSSNAFSMISGTNVLITGQPKFTTINGDYNAYENQTQITNVDSNIVVGNTLTETLYDNSQVFHVERRGRTLQVQRECRPRQHESTGNGAHQANASPGQPTSFPTQFPPSHFAGHPNSTTCSSGYRQTFPPALAAPFPNFTHNEGGIVSTSSFNFSPGDVTGMGEQSTQLFMQLFSALEVEHPALAPAASYDNSTHPTAYIDLTSGSSCSSPLADNRTAPIEAGIANLSIDGPVHASSASPFGGQHAAQLDYRASPMEPMEARMAGLSLNDPVQTTNAMSPVVTGMANLSLNQPAQSNYSLPADGVSAMLKGRILSAASMPDNNVPTSSGRPRVDTSSSTHLYGPPAASFTSTLFDSPVSQSPSTHPSLPAQRQTVPTQYRQSTVSDFGGVQIAPGAHVTSMTFNGSYTEVNHRQTTVNHGMSGMVVGNTVTHVRNVVGKESMMQPCDVKEVTRKHTIGRQGHIPTKEKKWAE